MILDLDIKTDSLQLMYYRIEVNPNNIGVVLETPFSLNPSRTGIAFQPTDWNLLNILVEISLMNDSSLSNVCTAALQQRPDIIAFLPGIWEVMFEKARPDNVKMRRTECTFFFKEKEDALNFKARYPGMNNGQLCEVVIIDERFMMECDMNWLDSINEKTANASEVIDAFKKYWEGKLTNKPTMEVLFAGKYMLKPL